jgi:hypothetical protein
MTWQAELMLFLGFLRENWPLVLLFCVVILLCLLGRWDIAADIVDSIHPDDDESN